jgi:hypothetical protein
MKNYKSLLKYHFPQNWTGIGKLRFYYLYELHVLKTSTEKNIGFHRTLA